MKEKLLMIFATLYRNNYPEYIHLSDILMDNNFELIPTNFRIYGK